MDKIVDVGKLYLQQDMYESLEMYNALKTEYVQHKLHLLDAQLCSLPTASMKWQIFEFCFESLKD